ncbi:lisH domain-containing protein ARMC9 [Trichonephila clavipes]|nr:lisH domain-containing protein ARMC9 [Trichonephila clavipes]
MGAEFLFMVDNARPHRVNIVDECLQSEDITRIEWPAYSPDLNPIEQIEDGSSDEEDDDQENDNLETEIDSNDSVTCDSNEVSGEDLLQLFYDYKGEAQAEEVASPTHSARNADSASVINYTSEIRSAASEISLKQNSLLSSSLISEQPLTPKLDMEATQMVRKIVGMPSTTLVEAAVVPDPASVTIKGLK